MSVDNFEQRRYIVNSADCQEIQEAVAGLPDDLYGKKVVEPVADFIRQLFELRNVHGVVLTCGQFGNSQGVLSVDVIMPMTPEDQVVVSDHRSVLRSNAELSRRLPISNGLSFVNALTREDVDRLKPPFQSFIPGLTPGKESLVAFVVFDRPAAELTPS